MARKIIFGVLIAIGGLLCVAEFVLAFFLASMALGVISFCLMLGGVNVNPWVKCPLPLPEPQPQVVFMQRNAHAFLAECHYKLKVKGPSGTDEIKLPFNSGGCTFLELSYYSKDAKGGPWLRFVDGGGDEWAVDLSSEISYRLLRMAEPQSKAILREIVSEYDSGLLNETEIDISRWALSLEPGQFLGRLNGREHPLCFERAATGEQGVLKPSLR